MNLNFITGFLFDVTGHYELAFIVAGAAICGAGVICLPLRIFRRCSGGWKIGRE